MCVGGEELGMALESGNCCELPRYGLLMSHREGWGWGCGRGFCIFSSGFLVGMIGKEGPLLACGKRIFRVV